MLPDTPLHRNASMLLMGPASRAHLAVIRALRDEIDRLHGECDSMAADAVGRQLAEELEVLSASSPALLAWGFLSRTGAVTPAQQCIAGAR